MSDDKSPSRPAIIPAVIPAVGAVIFRGSDVLLVKRGRPPLKGHWSIPGGKLEHGEALHAALAREVREETGCEVEIVGLINVFEARPQREGDAHYLLIDYAARWLSGEPVPADDADEAEFVPYAEALSRLAWDQTRTALQQARLAIRRAEDGGAG